MDEMKGEKKVGEKDELRVSQMVALSVVDLVQ